MAAIDRLGWAATSTFHVGDLHLGVRSSTPEADALLRRILAAYLVEGVEAPPNYSVRIELAGGTSRVRSLNMLYHSSTMVVRARSPRRVVDALVSYLSGHAEPGQGLLTLAAALVGEDGNALLVPQELLSTFEVLQPQLQRRGLRFVDRMITAIDPLTAEVVVGPGLTGVQEPELPDAGVGRDLPTVPAGRYPIRAWALFQGAGLNGPMSRAASVAAASRSVLGVQADPHRTLQGLADLFGRIRGAAIWVDDPVIAAERLGALLATDR